MDSQGNLYWTDAVGGIRFLNTTANSTANYCVCSSPPCTSKFYGGSWVWWAEYISCSQLAMTGASTGLVLDNGSGIMYVAINATAISNPTALDSQIIAVLDGVAYQFCGSGSSIVSDSDCSDVVYQAPQNLLLYGGHCFSWNQASGLSGGSRSPSVAMGLIPASCWAALASICQTVPPAEVASTLPVLAAAPVNSLRRLPWPLTPTAGFTLLMPISFGSAPSLAGQALSAVSDA